MQRLGRSVAVLVLLAPLASVVVIDALAGGTASSKRVVTVGSITTGEARVVVRATKSGAGAAPVAIVTATTYARTGAGAGWRTTNVRRLPGPFFWNVVSGPRAVCRLEVATAGAAPRFRPRAIVQLLVTPSIGCGRTTTLRLGA